MKRVFVLKNNNLKNYAQIERIMLKPKEYGQIFKNSFFKLCFE